MLYIIGLGLNERGYSREAYSAIQKCKKVYLESYTVAFPYDIKKLNEILDKEIEPLGREEVESDKLVKEAKKSNTALLVYGSPLFATTHMTLIQDAKKAGIKVQIIYAASIYDAIGETGLHGYKFGKTASIPGWQKGYQPDSFADIIKENQSIGAHTLMLSDIGLSLPQALRQLEQAAKHKKLKIEKVIVCSQLGISKAKILYNTIPKLKEKKKTKLPFCIIVPSKLHFTEEEVLRKV